MRIDAHQHFWTYNDSMTWITPEMAAIRKDFAAPELSSLLKENSIDGSVLVQVDQTDEETQTLLEIADQYNFIKGIVGWIDLRAENIAEQLAAYEGSSKLKGFRHILQAEEPAYMLQKDFRNGIRMLGEMGYTYDILIYPNHLSAATEMVEQFPDQLFVIDHLAKPDIKNGLMENWEKQMRNISQFPNVYCKVSGMVTEADWQQWTPQDLIPYLDVVTEAFGTDRLMFGSDWPVCLVAASYAEVLDVVKNYFSSTEQDAVLGDNATKFYHLS